MAQHAHATPLTIEARQTILEAELIPRVIDGWWIVERTATTAQLARKRPWWSTWLITLFTSGPPILRYLGAAHDTVHLLLDVEEDGTLRRRAAEPT